MGHAHPGVAAAVSQQLFTLNTNSRYLHEAYVEYAEEMAALCPDPLQARGRTWFPCSYRLLCAVLYMALECSPHRSCAANWRMLCLFILANAEQTRRHTPTGAVHADQRQRGQRPGLAHRARSSSGR